MPSNPQRVVCLDSGFSWQTLVSVGLMPVGMPTLVDSLVLPANLAKVTGVARVTNDAGEPDLYPLPNWFIYCYSDAMAQLGGLTAACEKLT